MIAFYLDSPMRKWRSGMYPVSPFIHLTARDESGPLFESAQLMTGGEIDDFFGRAVFRLRLLPKYAEQACEAAKRELAHQQARIRGYA